MLRPQSLGHPLPFLSHIPIHQQILLSLSSKYTQNLATSHHAHCYLLVQASWSFAWIIAIVSDLVHLLPLANLQSIQYSSRSSTFRTCHFSAQNLSNALYYQWSPSPDPDTGFQGPTQSRPLAAFLTSPGTPAHSALTTRACAVLEHTWHTPPQDLGTSLENSSHFPHCLLLPKFLIFAHMSPFH